MLEIDSNRRGLQRRIDKIIKVSISSTYTIKQRVNEKNRHSKEEQVK